MSDDQFTKLTKQLDERFAKIDERFDKQDERFDKQDATILKLYRLMVQRFDAIHDELANKADRDQVDRVYNLVDEDLKRRETDEQERLAANHQLDRHQGWIKQLADGTSTKLVPEP